MKTVLLKDGFAVTPQGVVRTDIILCDGKIELTDGKDRYDKVVDVTGKYVVPGFVDIHFHGYELFDFTVGFYDPQTGVYDDDPAVYQKCLDKLCKKLAEFGVTGFYIAAWAAPVETLRHACGQLADYLSKADKPPAARLFGGNLEGTFISPAMCGAQNPELVREPDPKVFDAIEDTGTIKLVNVAPDAGEKSYRLIEYLTKKGIVVGAGHSGAMCSQVADAMRAGLKYCVHFFNGPISNEYLSFEGGGVTEAGLKFDELYAELICDGFHVNPSYVRDTIKRKGVDKIIGVTDCMFVAGSQLKEFTAGGIRGAVAADGSHLRVVDKANTLFGSNLTMNRGFNNCLNWLTSDMEGIWNRWHEAMDFEKALTAAAKIYSTNPCKLTSLAKEGFGSIIDGAKADLAVLDIAGSEGNYKVTVESTIVAGNPVYSAK